MPMLLLEQVRGQ